MQRFYLVTLDTCKHCHDFVRDVWPELIRYIMDMGYEIQHHDVKYKEQRQWKINNPHISYHVIWYPTLLIVNESKDVFRYEEDMQNIETIKEWVRNIPSTM